MPGMPSWSINFWPLFLLLWMGCTLSRPAHSYEVVECTDRWYENKVGMSANLGESWNYKGSDCGKRGSVRTVGPYYGVVGNNAYWIFTEKERHGPCGGKGVGAFGQMFDLRCYLPSRFQRFTTYQVNEHYLLSRHGAQFRLLEQPREGLADWQIDYLDRTATDGESVFIDGNPVEGADPKTFEVFFPLGKTKFSFHISKDKHRSYYDTQPLPRNLWDRLEAIPISCIPTEDFPCGDGRVSQGYVDHTILARSGKDIVYIHYGSKLTIFKGLVSRDITAHVKNLELFMIKSGKTYRIKPGLDEDASLERVDRP